MQQPLPPQPYIYQSAVGNQPPEAPGNWFGKHKRLLVRLGIGLVIAVVVLLAVLFFVNRHRANVALEKQNADQAASAIASAVRDCSDAQDPNGCAKGVQPSLARDSGKESYCSGLSGTEYDNCVGLAALTAQSEEICRLIEDTERQASCLTTVAALNNREPRTYSDEIRAAMDARNPELCASIVDATDQATCYEVVGEADIDLDGLAADVEGLLGTSDTDTDSDDDGLSDFDEVNTWQTNPAKADTDGDSFSDGTEVQGGYNPNGSGKL